MDNLEEFAGLPVDAFESGQKLDDQHAYRIMVDYDPEEPWVDLFAKFVQSPGAERVKALLVGNWGEVGSGVGPDEVIESLVGARSRLPALEALFFGDIAQEESEISWIVQGDLSPLLSAFPKLRELGIRGGQNLSLGHPNHPNLQRLVIETGGLNRNVVQQVLGGSLPSLVHLELWLGDDGYGANTTPADFAALADSKVLPKLQTLGLRNCHYASELAKALSTSPVLERIQVLDLSMGTLTDEGAEALLAAPAVKRLHKLDLHFHYLSSEMQQRLKALPIAVDVGAPQEGDEDGDETYRYVAVSE